LVWLHGAGEEGKLTGAVDHWWNGDGSAGDELLADLKAYGADASVLPAQMFKRKEYEVWAEHEDAVLMFLRCQTQWRTTSAGVMGLDYGVVLQLMDLYAVSSRRQVLEDLQIMEAHARDLYNKAAQKAAQPKPSGKRSR
jgi:hypothetical protein